MFRGILIQKDETGCHSSLADLSEEQLLDGEQKMRLDSMPQRFTKNAHP
jgi:hypothetical protein